ncbi:MAG: hypothetical protein H7X91_05055 [Burkholderiales bacterium]|nr:hypothetical protein [Burkholderiales bacterium]
MERNSQRGMAPILGLFSVATRNSGHWVGKNHGNYPASPIPGQNAGAESSGGKALSGGQKCGKNAG